MVWCLFFFNSLCLEREEGEQQISSCSPSAPLPGLDSEYEMFVHVLLLSVTGDGSLGLWVTNRLRKNVSSCSSILL